MIDVKVNQVAYNRMMQKIADLSKHIKDLTPVWKDFAKYYPEEIIEKAFTGRGTVMGAKWPAFNKQYLRWKQKHYSGKPMLVISGQLKADATTNIRTEIKKDNMAFIIDNPLAGIHQLNKKKPRPFAMKKDKTLPARAVTWLIQDMWKHIKGDWK